MLNRRDFPLARSLRIGLTAGSVLLATVACTSAVALHTNVSEDANAKVLEAASRTRVPAGVMAGQAITKVTPKYPEEAKRARIQGAVVLAAIIGKDGSVENLNVVSGPEELRASALDAVRQWVYKPYLLNGEPTEVETTITVTYSLADSPAPTPAAALPRQADGVVSPRLLSQSSAKYPAGAREAGISGEVVVGLKVMENGTVNEVAAVSGPVELRVAAVDAVKQYLFQPATLHGRPVPVDMRVAINFQTF